MDEDAEPSQEGNRKIGEQILKVCEDREYVDLIPTLSKDSNGSQSFKRKDNEDCSWASGKEKSITTEDLRRRIEPWLTALCQSEQLSLLVGSGLSHAVYNTAANKPLNLVDVKKSFQNEKYEEKILTEAKRISQASGRSDNAGCDDENIEDIIRVANELIRGLEILNTQSDSAQSDNTQNDLEGLKNSLADLIQKFTESIQEIEQGICEADSEKRVEAFNYLVNFLMSFASRSGTRDRLHIFTTNYDRVIEAGADVAGLHLLDRFVGALNPVFRSSRLDLDIHYNPPGIRGEPRYLEGVARYTKLHGSLDWINDDGSIKRIAYPLGEKNLKSGYDSAKKLMIYPNVAKDRETSGYPYVELFRDLAAACCRPNHTLFTYGYSFGDEHINRVIEDMLTIPSTHLVAIAYDDNSKRIRNFYRDIGRSAQISLIIGDYLADLETLVDWFLPKPAIDRAFIRMNKLLEARLGRKDKEFKNSDSSVEAKEVDINADGKEEK